ncbi:hypothetical protein QTP88_011529 [Uroleucon formosanum]
MKCVSLILEEAKSCSRSANKVTMCTGDITEAVLKYLNYVRELISDKILISCRSDQNVDDLPVISDLDIEEFIESIQDNQDPNADKVKEFNVDSLLNDPYTL